MSTPTETVTIHGAALRDNCRKVMITDVITNHEDDELPFPGQELIYLKDARNSFVEWPLSHININLNKVLNRKILYSGG